MSSQFLGFDHIDTRVRCLAAVEPFYDLLMPKLGLPNKRKAHVDRKGDWHDPSDERPYNTVEYYEERVEGRAVGFIGFVEDQDMAPTLTRIAFRIATPGELGRWLEFLKSIGAVNIEESASENYPALFFEDPAGTKLEICSRLPGVQVT
jgi:catechol 2,3-dioxygenase-like lactoylglutathione lyase family enzyme